MTKCSNNSNFDQVRALVNNIIYLVVILFFGFLLLGIYFNQDFIQRNYGHLTRTKVKVSEQNTLITDTSDLWQAQDIELVKDTILKAKLLYGRELVVHTAKYLGPKGSVMQSSNGLNCQNCHLDAGTKPWGNNYGSVFSLYPKFRPRSGSIENIYKRINDCFERSLVEPTAKLEVVCHGPGLDMLHKYKTTVAGKVEEFALKGVVFNACQFTMKEKKYSTQDILPSPGFVEAGIIHIVKMQDKGWHYIKAGF